MSGKIRTRKPVRKRIPEKKKKRAVNVRKDLRIIRRTVPNVIRRRKDKPRSILEYEDVTDSEVEEYERVRKIPKLNRFESLQPKTSESRFGPDFRESVWRGVQRPGMDQPNFFHTPAPVSYSYTNSVAPQQYPTTVQAAPFAFSNPPGPYIVYPSPNGPQFQGVNVIGKPRETPEAELFVDANEYLTARRPTDGEKDSDRRLTRWTLDQVMRFLERLPGATRRSLLTTLFGTAVGVVLDVLLGGTLGLTSTVFRLLLRLVPGGSVILWGIDGLAYILSRISNPFAAENDPSFVDLANNVQQQLPTGTSEALTRAAEVQLGSGVARQIGAVVGAVLSNAASLAPTIPFAVPLGIIRRM